MPDKVLVVDDEENIRNLLSAFLAKEGYEVIVAANGEEALELVATANPQVVLLDVTMPGVDGIEVCERLKTDSIAQISRDLGVLRTAGQAEKEDPHLVESAR